MSVNATHLRLLISFCNCSVKTKNCTIGWLRFGTEAGHSGTRDYQIRNGSIFRGHWEIHPVERVEAIDGREAFQIGPSARMTSWPIAERYKVTNANFATPGLLNYAKLVGTVQGIVKSPDKSGDVVFP